MLNITLRPGDDVPDDPCVLAALAVNSAATTLAEEMRTHFGSSMSENDAISSVMSGLVSVVANLAVRWGCTQSVALNLHRAAVEIRPHPPNAPDVFRLAQHFLDLMNLLAENQDVETVVIAMLNASGNAGTHTGNTNWVAEHMRDFADMLTDPERLAKAEATAAMMARPADVRIQ